MTRNPLIPHKRKSGKKSGGGKAARELNEKRFTAVTSDNAAERMATFIKYYKAIEIVPEEEWDRFLETIITISPVTFRFSRLHRLTNIPMEGRKGTQSQPEVLLDIFKETILPRLQEQLLGKKQVTVAPVPWYRPHGYAWQTNFDPIEFRRYAGLKEFADFVIEETIGFNVMRQDLHLLFPPMLIDIQPRHKILDMCSAPGFMSNLVLESLYANPKKAPDGFLVANDKSTNHIQWRWTQGTNCLFLAHDARFMPELYLSAEHTDENKLRYDRILLDPPCSQDGNFRKTPKLRGEWKFNKSYEMHMDQVAMLQRGLELLAVGGELLYTTTSMHPVENEAVVAALLKMAPDSLELVDRRNRVPGFICRPGLSKWKVMTPDLELIDTIDEAPGSFVESHPDSIYAPSDAEDEVFQLERCIRVVPHDNDTTAFFCAVIRKVAEIPWESAVPPVGLAMPAQNTTPEQSVEELLKHKYIPPLELAFSVHLAEMEWTTEVTNARLETTSTTSIEKYDQPPVIVADRCINQKVKQELMKVKSFLSQDDGDWKKLKSFYKLKDGISPTSLIKRNGGRARNTVYYYMHPIIKQISELNTHLTTGDSGLKNFGLKAFRTYEHELSPHCGMVVSDIGLMGTLPFLGARVVNVTRDDLVKLIMEKTLAFDQLSPKARQTVEAMEPGCVVYYYKSEGKKSVPNCDIAFVGWRNRSFVKSAIDQKNDDIHMLRLCGETTSDRSKYSSSLFPIKTIHDVADDDDADVAADDDEVMEVGDDVHDDEDA